VRSTPDPTLTMSQSFAEAHQCRIYAPIMRLGPGRSTLALGINEASVHEWRAWARSSWALASCRPPVGATDTSLNITNGAGSPGLGQQFSSTLLSPGGFGKPNIRLQCCMAAWFR